LYNDDFHSLDYIDIMAASLKKREYEKIWMDVALTKFRLYSGS
jgi:hypothetical protein